MILIPEEDMSEKDMCKSAFLYSHFLPLSLLDFQQASPSLSVVVTFKSEISPRETVGLRMWRSASAGDVVCPGLMSLWRY